MTGQNDAAAERSAHERDPAEGRCHVCGGPWRKGGASYAARVLPPLVQVCSADCAAAPGFAAPTGWRPIDTAPWGCPFLAWGPGWATPEYVEWDADYLSWREAASGDFVDVGFEPTLWLPVPNPEGSAPRGALRPNGAVECPTLADTQHDKPL